MTIPPDRAGNAAQTRLQAKGLCRLITALFLGQALVTLSGCTKVLPPDSAFDRWAEAAESGDGSTFLSGFTTQSRVLVEGMVAISSSEQHLFSLGRFSEKVRARQFNEQSDGVALVLVQTTDASAELGQVVMRLEDGQWRIDLISTELLWNRSWELSGRASRGDGTTFGFDPLDSLGGQR